MTSSLNPGSSSALVRDAHYHAIAATKTWEAFAAGMLALVKESAEAAAAERAKRKRETSYERRSIDLPPL